MQCMYPFSRLALMKLELSRHIVEYIYYYYLWLCIPARPMASSSTRFLHHTQRRATVGRTPLDE
jgi:hypothetical protein